MALNNSFKNNMEYEIVSLAWIHGPENECTIELQEIRGEKVRS